MLDTKGKVYSVFVKALNRAVEFPCPETLPEPGTVLSVVRPFATAAGYFYWPGDTLTLVKRTSHDPHGHKSSLGNWIVDCRHLVSVWSNIEDMIADGTLK